MLRACALLLTLFMMPAPAAAAPACLDCDADGVAWPADCNDADPFIHPGAMETCDGVDSDCDGLVDNHVTCVSACPDADRLGENLRVSSGTGASLSPSLTWTGADYGVAWEDERNGNADIYFARLDAGGLRMAAEVAVTVDPTAARAPSLAWTGSEHAVAWVDGRHGDDEVYFQRIDTSGALLGSALRVTDAVGGALDPQLVWSGHEFGLVWEDRRHGPGEIYFARLDAAGNLVGQEMRLTADPAVSREPVLVWTGSQFGVVWVDERQGVGLWFTTIDAGGAVTTAPMPLAVSGGVVVARPRLLWAAGMYALAWLERSAAPGTTTELRLARMDASGAPAVPVQTAVFFFGGWDLEFNVAWTGSEFGVAWARLPCCMQVGFTRVDELGSRFDPPGDDLLVGGFPHFNTVDGVVTFARGPALVWNGGGFGVAWSDTRSPEGPANEEIQFSPVACGCADADADGTTSCNDCDDSQALVYPGAWEICDGVNNDCLHPQWPVLPASEVDGDGDGLTSCLDNCPLMGNPDQADADADGAGDLCDLCPAVFDPDQRDGDGDGEGDACDLDDGAIQLGPMATATTAWQQESTYTAFHLYRGSMELLRSVGVYSQAPGASPLSAKQCDLTSSQVSDTPPLAPGDVAFYLVSGVAAGAESGLGNDSSGAPRPHHNPCP